MRIAFAAAAALFIFSAGAEARGLRGAGAVLGAGLSGLSHSGVKTYPAGVLRPSELAVCLSYQDRMEAMVETLEQFESTLGPQKRDLDFEQSQLERRLVTVNRSDQSAVDAFNLSASLFEESRSAYNARVDEYDQQVASLQGTALDHDRACEGRRYYEDDYESARRQAGQLVGAR